MITVEAAVRAGAARLEGVESPLRDARLLMAHVLGVIPDRLILMARDSFTQQAAFDALITRRSAREPVSHILGRRAFYGRVFEVTSDVLDPRPETEVLITTALASPFERVLDLGTGSGAILLTLFAERSDASGVGCDLSEAALSVAKRNAAALGVTAEFTQSHWFSNVTGPFDLIVSNPPYIALDEMPALSPELSYEPRMALTDEGDGLEAYRAICAEVLGYLTPNGRLIVEIGPTQGAAVSELMRAAGLTQVTIHPDLDGRDRVISAVRPA